MVWEFESRYLQRNYNFLDEFSDQLSVNRPSLRSQHHRSSNPLASPICHPPELDMRSEPDERHQHSRSVQDWDMKVVRYSTMFFVEEGEGDGIQLEARVGKSSIWKDEL